jgi:hypothetical protein
MKSLHALAAALLLTPIAQAQAPAGMAPTTGSAQAPTHVISQPTSDSVHGKAAAALTRRAIPSGHTETPLTIKPTNGGTLATKECGAVSELTVLHRSDEPAMLSLIMQAAKDGKTLQLTNAKCLGEGKAVASSAGFAPVVAPELPLAERCKLPYAKESIAGC